VWSGQIVSQIGDSVTKLALLWFVYSITGSPLKTSIIGTLQTLPPILFGPLIGVYLDRLPKKAILIGTELFRAVIIGLIPCLLPIELFTVERLYLLVFLHAVATAVFGPALSSSVPFLVPRSQFLAANGLLQSTTSIGVIFGPALSGLGIAAFSSQAVLCVNAITYLISAACLLPVRLPHVKMAGSRHGAPAAFRQLIEGFRFMFVQQRTLLLLILIAAVHTFATSAFSTLFPVFGRTLLDLGPVEVGYLWSALGIGLLLMSLLLVRFTEWPLTTRLLLIATASVVTAVAFCGLLGAADLFVAAALMGVIGGGMGIFTPIAWAVVQELAPENMLGRALALYTTGAMAAAIISMSAFGYLTQMEGARASIFVLSAVMLVAAAMAMGFAWFLQSSSRRSG
jgi:DHA3 family macrolide efflux protein-like MFS transporter